MATDAEIAALRARVAGLDPAADAAAADQADLLQRVEALETRVGVVEQAALPTSGSARG